MDALKQKKGTLTLSIVLWEDYDLLAVYGAYEFFIVCQDRFAIQTVGATPFVKSHGAPDARVDCSVCAKEDIPSSDIVLVPDGTHNPELEKWILSQKNALVLRVGPKAKGDEDDALSFVAEMPEVLVSVSGADLAAYAIEQLAGPKALKKAEEMVEYKAKDPFLPVPTKPSDVPAKDIQSPEKPIRLGIFIFDGFEMLDTFGPMAAFVATKKLFGQKQQGNPLFEFTFYAEKELVQSSRGPLFRADRLLEDAPAAVDWLLIPGGLGTVTENHNPVGQEWTRSVVAKADKVITVCTGSGYLASMGVLDGKKATTNKLAHYLVASWGTKVEWQPQARWIHDGRFWTSSGVAAGTDQALAIVESEFGPRVAAAVAHGIGWHHRVTKGDQDCFVAKPTFFLENIVLNALMTVLCSWLPKSWRPSPATIDKYLAP